MTLVDGKMRFLGNYNHDFPRLAKESGFFFQLHKGKVNWSEIESLNLDDITENRKFELLERNLLNVINCNLEKDYDLKILDQNFVKLFKLAQLGIDYLSYCELYLDRCVVILQEQLMSVQEELESLKCENERKNSELKVKTKKKVNNYQCEKCEKIFISDVYLKFHDKRRHSNLSTPKSDEGSFRKLLDASQQTENERKLSVAVQTFLEETITATEKNEEIRKIKKIHNKKMKKMEKNVKNLNARLQRAEKSLWETREVNPNSAPVSFPSSLHYHALLQFMPPCFPPSQNADEVIPEYNKTLPRNRSPESDLVVVVDPKIDEGQKSFTSGDALLKEYKAGDTIKTGEIENLDLTSNKENMDPQITKPLPPPRKSKKKIQNFSSNEENLTAETFNQLSDSAHFGSRSMDFTSVKGKSDPNINKETFEEIKASFLEDMNTKKTISNESLNTSNERPKELQSFFKKVVGRSSPRLQTLSKNLKRPFANFYDSISSTGKDFTRTEKQTQSIKTVLVDGVNNQLRELGVDPEWKGIPKKTMKQKLKNLTHRRKLLSKENSLYSSVRQSTEEKIFEKLKNFSIRRNFPQKSCIHSNHELEGEIHPSVENPYSQSQRSENVTNSQNHNAILVDIDVESCSRMSELENSRKEAPLLCGAPQPKKVSDSDSEENSLELEEKEFDINVFQIKKRSAEKRQEKETILNEMDELLTNSDFEDNFSIRSEGGILKTFNRYIDDKNNCGKF